MATKKPKPAPNTSATESPVKPADVSETQPAETIPPAGDPSASEPTGSSPSNEAKDSPPAGEREYTVLSPLDHDGQRYEIGDVVTLGDHAAQLLVGVVKALDGESEHAE
jgi:hypothetical protein